jgi:hypothetical protein
MELKEFGMLETYTPKFFFRLNYILLLVSIAAAIISIIIGISTTSSTALAVGAIGILIAVFGVVGMIMCIVVNWLNQTSTEHREELSSEQLHQIPPALAKQEPQFIKKDMVYILNPKAKHGTG